MECGGFTVEERIYAAREFLVVERGKVEGSSRKILRQIGGIGRRAYREPQNVGLFRELCSRISEVPAGRTRERLLFGARALACHLLLQARERLNSLSLFDQADVPHICLELRDRLAGQEFDAVLAAIVQGSEIGRSRLPGYIWKMKIFFPEVAREVRLVGSIFRIAEENGLAKLATGSNGNGAGSSLNRALRNGSRRGGRTVHGV